MTFNFPSRIFFMDSKGVFCTHPFSPLMSFVIDSKEPCRKVTDEIENAERCQRPVIWMRPCTQQGVNELKKK